MPNTLIVYSSVDGHTKKICDKIYNDIDFGLNNKLEEEIMVLAYHNLKRIKINESDSSLSLFFDNRTYSLSLIHI